MGCASAWTVHSMRHLSVASCLVPYAVVVIFELNGSWDSNSVWPSCGVDETQQTKGLSALGHRPHSRVSEQFTFPEPYGSAADALALQTWSSSSPSL